MATRKYNTWKQEDMDEALQKHRSGEIGFNEACRRFNMIKYDKITNNSKIKSHLNILSPVPCIKTVIEKMKKGTKPTMELTSSTYKNEIEAKENINKRKKPVLDIKKVKTEKGINKTKKRRNANETCTKNKKIKAKESWLCQLCKEDREENMIQCMKCKGWIHDQCAGVGSKIKKYICDVCVQSQ